MQKGKLTYKIKILQKYKVSIILALGLFLVVMFLLFNVLGSFYLYLFYIGFILSYYVLKETAYNKFFFFITLSFLLSSSLIIVISSVLSIFSIPLNIYVLLLPFLLCLVLLFLEPVQYKKVKLKLSIEEVFLLFLLLSSFVLYILSVLQYQVPILHDPIAHSTWAKEIYNTGKIDFFYSPGLHILSAFGMMSDGVNVATYVMFITNIFASLTFVPVYLFIKEYFKKKTFALLSAFLFVVGLFPFKFVWSAGKNPLVISFSLIFLLLFFSSIELNKTIKFLTINILIFALILLHYPAAFIGLIGIFLVLLYKEKIRGVLYSLPGCFLGLIWGFTKMNYETERLSETVSSGRKAMELTFKNVLLFYRDLYHHLHYYFDHKFGIVLLIGGIVGLGIMFLLIFKKKKKEYLFFFLFFLINLLSMLILKSVEILLPFNIIYLTQTLTLFLFVYIGLAFLLSEVILPYIFEIRSVFKIFFYVIMIIITLYVTYAGYNKYKSKQENLNMVTTNDLKVFEWINESLTSEDIILNNSARSERESVIGTTDGGGWIPVYTNNSIAMPFTEFSSKSTHEIYEIYNGILNSEYTCEDIEFLLDKNINYYYKAERGVWGIQFKPSVENKNFLLIYRSGNSKLYEIKSCEY